VIVLPYLADARLYTKKNQRTRWIQRKLRRFSRVTLMRKMSISLERKRKTSQRYWSLFLPRVGKTAVPVLGGHHLPLVLPETPPSIDRLLLAGSDLLRRVAVSTMRTKRTFVVRRPREVALLPVVNRLVAHAVDRHPETTIVMAVARLVDQDP
jgi:hypothetical protein